MRQCMVRASSMYISTRLTETSRLSDYRDPNISDFACSIHCSIRQCDSPRIVVIFQQNRANFFQNRQRSQSRTNTAAPRSNFTFSHPFSPFAYIIRVRPTHKWCLELSFTNPDPTTSCFACCSNNIRTFIHQRWHRQP